MSAPSGSEQSGVADVPPDPVGAFLDAVTYAVAVTALFAAVSAVATLAVGGRLAPGVKYGLFVFGWIALGYGTLLSMPEKPWKDDDEGLSAVGDVAEDVAESGFQAYVQALPPARFRQVPPSNRLSTGARVLLGAVCMLAVSLALEQLFGVGP